MEFTYQGRTYTYSVVRKRMKNIILHIREDGTVYVSAPSRVPAAEIHSFVLQNAAHIVRKLGELEEQRREEPDFADGSAVPHLGGTLTLRYSPRPCITTCQDGVLSVFARNPEEARLAHRRWLVDECVALYREINREMYERFTAAGYAVPLAHVEVKDMRSRWGSCTRDKGRISMNFRLMEYPKECIYAVFYHEYTHFLHSGHGKDFYAVLRQMYPEYDRADAILNGRRRNLG